MIEAGCYGAISLLKKQSAVICKELRAEEMPRRFNNGDVDIRSLGEQLALPPPFQYERRARTLTEIGKAIFVRCYRAAYPGARSS